MDKSDGTNFTSSVRKKHIFIGILFLMIIFSIKFFYSTNPKILSLHLTMTKSIQTATTFKYTTTVDTTTKTTSLAYKSPTTKITSLEYKSPTRTIKINPTTINYDEILCDNITEYHPKNLLENPCERIRCAIVLRSSGGRLGNRMFMFASAYGLARTHNCRLYVSTSIRDELSNNFRMKSIDEKIWLSDEELSQLKNIQKQDTVCSFLPELMRPNAFKNIELFGYWQSYLYFDIYREKIREIFSARDDALIRLAKYFTNITNSICSLCSPLPNQTHQQLRQAFQTTYNTTWISIHIRRQDFLGLHYASDDNYIRNAIIFFRRRYHQYHVRFLVASDDRNYCRNLFASEQKSGRIIILPDHFSPADDLMALSLCHHSIVTGGTYGFWSAYLAGGDVIHDSRYKIGCLRSDYYPPWFILAGSIEEKKV